MNILLIEKDSTGLNRLYGFQLLVKESNMSEKNQLTRETEARKNYER